METNQGITPGRTPLLNPLLLRILQLVAVPAAILLAAALAVAASHALPRSLSGLLALAFPERGVRQYRNYRWLLLGLAEILIVIWIAYAGRSSLSGTAWRDVLDHWLLRSPPTPIVARIMLATAFAAALARTWPRRGLKELRREPRPLDIGIAAALVAFFIGCEWGTTPLGFGAFMSAA